jgi:transposase
MHRLQEAIRLHRMGRSVRQISRQLRIGRDTVRQYFAVLAGGGVLDGAAGELPPLEVLRALLDGAGLEAKPPPKPSSSVDRWRPVIEAMLAKGASPTPIHDYLRLHERDYACSLSAVKRLCLRIARERGPVAEDVAIPVETVAGEVAQVDFGYVGKRYDPSSGVFRKCWVFVMLLGRSRHMFAEVVFDQRIETWLDLHVRAFEFFGGVPKVIVPDNLKAAVIRAAFGVDDDAVINRSYRELARHYGFQVDPTPPRSPEKKGKVERAVRYVKGNFFATREPVDVFEDRRELRRWTLEVAGRRRHGRTGEVPLEVFESEEQAALLPLPPQRWDPVLWKKATLHRDSHVQVDGAFYSAPWRLIGESLWARCTSSSVAIHHGDEYLWTHARVRRGQRSTIESHLPDHRRDLRHRSREFWVTRAERIGPEVGSLVGAIFGCDDVLLKLRQVQAVVTHLETFPVARARRAAARALHFKSLEYRAIKSILSKGLDLEPLPDERSRSWSQGSRFARRPTDVLLTRKGLHHGGL